MKTLTTANSVFALAINSLYPVAQILQGYAADDAFSADDIAPAEILMGVDGHMSAGYTPVPVPMNIMLQADSDSNQLFDDWFNAMQNARDVYFATGIVTLQGTNEKWALTRGILTSYKPMPDAKKLLQPRKFVITWESATKSPV
jgi:hypothetical protein